MSPSESSGTPLTCVHVRGTALHSGKDFAVSAGLNRIVSVRTSGITPDRRYLLPFSEIAHVRHLGGNVRTFLPKFPWSNYPTPWVLYVKIYALTSFNL